MPKLLFKKIVPLTAQETENIINTLSESARARLEGKTEKHAKESSLCAYSLLSEAQRADLCFDENGKPRFAFFDACISVSHSENYCAVLISDSKNSPVGVDIEENFLSTEKQRKIAERFFGENEKKAYRNGTPFCEIWTKKEALFKYLENSGITLLSADSETAEDCTFITETFGSVTLTACVKNGERCELIDKTE
ncbi:MAG: 4'-phosphopantetheinyl transferase family protein [Eubacteriales bacterium]